MSHVSKAIKLLNLLILLLFITSSLIINAQVPYNNESGKISVKNSYKDIKIGLALSAGGAKGIAHIGVIIAFEEEGIPIDLIAGTSIGSIIGGLYAVGYSGEELRKLVQIINWEEIFSENPESNSELISKRFGVMEPLIVFRFKFWDIYLPVGLLNGQKINDELFKYTVRANFAARYNFDSLFVPFRPVAVDISKGEAIAIDKGDLAQAIRGSMAIPLLFYPAKINNSNMVDGGVLNALPTDIIKKMGADIIIGVDLDGQFTKGKEPKNLMEIADHTINIMIRKLKQNNISLADVLIEPNLENYSSTGYSGFDSLIEIGYRAAKNKIDEIKRIIPPQALLNKKNKRQLDTTLLEKSIIGEINVIGNKNLFEKVILDDFPLSVGDQFNSNRAIQGSKNIYASGLFNNVWLELDTLAHEKVKININVEEKYPRTIGFGVNYVEDEGLSGFIQIIHFNLFGWGERLMPLFRFGKLRTKVGVEMANDRFFGTPLTFHNGLYYESEYPYLYNTDGKRIGQTDFKKIVGLFSVGIQPYRKVLLSGGIRWERVWVKYNKNSEFDYEKKDNLFLFGELITNNLDHRYLPAKGFKIKLEGETSLNYEKISELISKLSADLNWVIPLSVTQRIIPYCKMGISNQKLPVYEKFRLGGSINLPGYNRDELWGNHFIVLGILYRIEILKQMNVQFNFTLGSVYEKYQNFRWNNLSSGVSGGILALSPVGPIGLYYGRNENKRDILYLSSGYEF